MFEPKVNWKDRYRHLYDLYHLQFEQLQKTLDENNRMRVDMKRISKETFVYMNEVREIANKWVKE
jgi:hypothetical protein